MSAVCQIINSGMLAQQRDAPTCSLPMNDERLEDLFGVRTTRRATWP
jgi:hypothetical protein